MTATSGAPTPSSRPEADPSELSDVVEISLSSCCFSTSWVAAIIIVGMLMDERCRREERMLIDDSNYFAAFSTSCSLVDSKSMRMNTECYCYCYKNAITTVDVVVVVLVVVVVVGNSRAKTRRNTTIDVIILAVAFANVDDAVLLDLLFFETSPLVFLYGVHYD